MGQRITVVDAFTHVAYSGNPAAVCVLNHPTTDEWMQSVAREMRHSDTAFCVPIEDGGHELRWFTPSREVKLCGHATLAVAHVLWEEGRLPPNEVARFTTLSGELTATPGGRLIELDFPALVAEKVGPPAGLLAALGLAPDAVQWLGRGGEDYVLVLADPAAVGACEPDFSALRGVETRGTIITAAGGDECEFVSRFFAPLCGIDEDPVTGSAHCVLAPLWAERLGKSEMRARQLSERGGELQVEVVGERVLLRGTCVTTLRGDLAESAPERDDP